MWICITKGGVRWPIWEKLPWIWGRSNFNDVSCCITVSPNVMDQLNYQFPFDYWFRGMRFTFQEVFPCKSISFFLCHCISSHLQNKSSFHKWTWSRVFTKVSSLSQRITLLPLFQHKVKCVELSILIRQGRFVYKGSAQCFENTADCQTPVQWCYTRQDVRFLSLKLKSNKVYIMTCTLSVRIL